MFIENKLVNVWCPSKGEEVIISRMECIGIVENTEVLISKRDGSEIDLVVVEIPSKSGYRKLMKFRKDELIPRRMLVECILG
jgi:hypothetical protein